MLVSGWGDWRDREARRMGLGWICIVSRLLWGGCSSTGAMDAFWFLCVDYSPDMMVEFYRRGGMVMKME